jgi:peroxiredoxin
MLVLFAATLGIVGWIGLPLIKQNGRLMLRLEALERRLQQQGGPGNGLDPGNLGRPPGSVLNDFALPLLSGGTMTLSQWRGRKVVLIFLSPRCKHCERILPDLEKALPRVAEADPAPVIVSTGTVEENRRFFGDRFQCPIVLQEDSEVAALYMALATPMAYVVDENGATLGHAAVGGSAILDLFTTTAAAEPAASGHSRVGGSIGSSQINRDGLKAGTPAPEFTLPALDGSEVSLKSFRGKPLLLVFSDPTCGPCNEILPKLEEIHRKSHDLSVLLISRGTPEANRKKVEQLRLTLPVVLQRGWEISRDYGMFATPIGYLVGEDGVLEADVAPGGNAILALAAEARTRARV